MFDCYIGNVSIDTYDYGMVQIDDSIYNPIKEYLFHLPTGFLGASLIGQTVNPHIIQNYQHCFDKNFSPKETLKPGDRQNLLAISHSEKKMNTVKEILRNQTGEDAHHWTKIMDPRFPEQNTMVPFFAIGATKDGIKT